MDLRHFLQTATKRERVQLATVCNGSVAYLYQLAGQHRHASPQMATRIEQVSRQVAAHSGGRLELGFYPDFADTSEKPDNGQ